MPSTVSTTFPDSTYTSSSKPSAVTLQTDISAIETALNANAASMTENTDSNIKTNTWVVDEDTLTSDLDTKVPTQQSVKAYVDSGTVTMTNKTLTSPVLNTGVSGTAVLDEDAMGSDSATKLATQQSIKAYHDNDITEANTASKVVRRDASKNINVTAVTSDDHLTLTPDTSKLVKTAVLRQDNTTNSYANGTVILTGWGQKQGAGASELTDTVTFGVTFAAAPIVIVGALDRTDDATSPTAITEFDASPGAAMVLAGSIGTGGFTARMRRDADVLSASYYYGYSWMAIGILA